MHDRMNRIEWNMWIKPLNIEMAETIFVEIGETDGDWNLMYVLMTTRIGHWQY